MADSDEDTVEETKETVKKMFDQIYNLLLKEKSKEVDSSAEFWDAIKTLDWMGAVSLASNNIQTIQEYALLVLKVVFYNFTLFLSTLSGKVLKLEIFIKNLYSFVIFKVLRLKKTTPMSVFYFSLRYLILYLLPRKIIAQLRCL